MQVVLISPYSQISSLGLRILSSCLKQNGFETRMIFLPDVDEMIVGAEYSDRELSSTAAQQIADLCADAGLVGITAMTSSFHLARQLTIGIHQAHDVPVIWGGIHPTVRPAECLEYADLVCIGEGEDTIIELARRIDMGETYHDVKNLAYRDGDGKLVQNPLYPLVPDLDELPLPDHDFSTHYVLHEGNVVPCTRTLMEYYLSDIASWTRSAQYGILTTRGCPYKCSFCVNNTMVDIYDKWSKLRMRSPENVVAEINDARARMPAIGAVVIRDDTFLANPPSYMRKFAKLYKEEVGLPFQAYTTARTVDQKKLDLLVDAGLTRVIMGVQSGSERVQKIYKRDWATNEQIIDAAHVINRYKEQIPKPMYDVIVDSPYETEDDRLETLQLIHELPQPYKLSLFSLTFYPGTEIHDRAEADGFIGNQETAVYEHNFQIIAPTFHNLALFLHHLNLPKPLLWFTVQRPIYQLMSKGILNKFSGWVLNRLMKMRVKSNESLFKKRRNEWLVRLASATNSAADAPA